ncbi:MAG: helix-turn-helix domain-containing protein [Myxococcota bacterium]
MAGQLGVPTIEVARAEGDPREKVRPALQVALMRAIAEFRSAGAGPTTPPGTVTPALTGADLVRFREAHGLTQRQAAERLGVAHGTVAKAELLPSQPLRDRLQDALRAALRR